LPGDTLCDGCAVRPPAPVRWVYGTRWGRVEVMPRELPSPSIDLWSWSVDGAAFGCVPAVGVYAMKRSRV
jgi:hypothetical protein